MSRILFFLLCSLTAFSQVNISTKVSKAGDTMTGDLLWNNTNVPGLRLNNLTTVQRDATTPAAGNLIWNTTTSRANLYDGSAWNSGWVRLAGDTMTGALVINGGSVAVSTPPLDITQTWNDGAGGSVVCIGPTISITDTASGANSRPFRVRLGGATIFEVYKSGTLNSSGNVISGGGTVQWGTSGDTFITRTGAGNLSLKNLANAQTLNIFGTTDAGDFNYRRIRTTMTTGGAATIAAEGLGTGVSGNTLALSVNGNAGISISSGGGVTCGGSVVIPSAASFATTGRSVITFPVDGQVLLSNNSISDADFFLKLGINTSAAAGIKRVGTTLKVRLNDDSDYGAIETLRIRSGAGTPEAAVTAPVGAIYLRSDGGAGTSFYVKESGAGNTGWVAK